MKGIRSMQYAAKSLQSCPTLCDPIDGSPPGSPVQARTLEWAAISFSNAWKWKVKVKSLGRVQLLATPWTAAHQAPPSMGLSRQEYWSRVPLPSPGLYSPWDSLNQNTAHYFTFSRGYSQPWDQTQVSHIAGRFFTSWDTREPQEYWSV